MSVVAIIPARGGSKRIPRKNIKEFNGKPMISWSIEAAIESGCFDRILVSTDDEEIAAVAREFGAETPFMRPISLSDDHTGTIPVIKHALNWLNGSAEAVEYACCIYATAPFVSPTDIKSGLDILRNSSCDYVLSVTTYAFPIQRAIRLTNDHRIQMFYPEHFGSRSQDLEEAWHDAGQFYWGVLEAWMNERELFTEKSLPVILPRYRVQDIDTPEDWERAELLSKLMNIEVGKN